jgi:hypothetical protein
LHQGFAEVVPWQKEQPGSVGHPEGEVEVSGQKDLRSTKCLISDL